MPSDEIMMFDIISRMIDRALANRELSQSAIRDVRAGTYSQEKQQMMTRRPPKKRKVSQYAKELGRQWKLVKKKSRKKNGDFKKGWDAKREMIVAHRQTKKARKSTRMGQVRKTARRAYER